MRILETMYVILSYMCVTRLGETLFLAYVNVGIHVLIDDYKYYAHHVDDNSHYLASAARE